MTTTTENIMNIKATEKTETGKAAKRAKPVAKLKATENTAPINPPQEVYSKEMLTEISKRSKVIKTELGKVESCFSKIAFNLHWIYENNAYKPLGYKNVYDFAKVEFGIARGTCNNFISVVDRFAKRVNGEVVEQIDDCYKGFKSSQLILMLDLSDEDIKKLDCGLSVRDMKKEIKKLTTDEDGGKEASAESPEADEPIDVESKEVNRQVIITIRNMDEYDLQEDKIYDMIKRALKDPKHTVEIAYTW